MLAMPAAHVRFTAEEVRRLVATGVIREDEPVELLDGELIPMSPQGNDHRYVKLLLQEAIRQAYGAAAIVVSQDPIDAGHDSLPEPDVSVLRPPMRRYREEIRGDDALLVVEVAVTSQALDRKKARIYARAGVPRYWLVDVPARRVEVYQSLAEGGYALTALVGEDGQLELPELDAHLAVRDLLP